MTGATHDPATSALAEILAEQLRPAILEAMRPALAEAVVSITREALAAAEARPAPTRLLSVAEVAERLGVHSESVRRLARRGELVAVAGFRHKRFLESAVERFIAGRGAP